MVQYYLLKTRSVEMLSKMIEIYGQGQVCENFCQSVSEIPRAILVGQHVPCEKSFYWYFPLEELTMLMTMDKHGIASTDCFPPKCISYESLLRISRSSREFTFDDDGGYWKILRPTHIDEPFFLAL